MDISVLLARLCRTTKRINVHLTSIALLGRNSNVLLLLIPTTLEAQGLKTALNAILGKCAKDIHPVNKLLIVPLDTTAPARSKSSQWQFHVLLVTTVLLARK